MEEIFIQREKNILRIALREEGKLKECFIEEENNEPYSGQIYKGIVKNTVPSIKCAFMDIGFDKNAYMYIHKRFNNEYIKNGDELLVEIMRPPIGEKGPKVTNQISIPGRYVVIVTYNDKINFSKKIENDEEFKKFIKDNIDKPSDVGIMIRTNALYADIKDINTEVWKLYEDYKTITKQCKYLIKPKRLYDGGGILQKMLIDILSVNTKKVITNNTKDYKCIESFTESKSDLNFELELYEGRQNLFSYYNIEKEILSLRNNKVVLPNGGNIVIDKTEAMYVIDVNSGKNTKQNSIDKTALTTNLEAAEEIARQIMMRNLSGIIIIDFIDMNNFTNKKKVLSKLKESFNDDKKKTVIYPFTQVNLVQIVRKKSGKSIYEYIEEECKMCHGKGKRIKFSYITSLIKNEIAKISYDYDIKDIYIELNEIYKKDVLGDILTFITKLDVLDKKIYINFMENLEYFKVEPLLFNSQIKKIEDLKIYG